MVDISVLPGVQGAFTLRVRDADCDIKELIRISTSLLMRDDQNRLQIQSKPFQALALMIQHDMLLGWRLPAKRTSDEGADEIVAVQCDVIKVGKEAAIKQLSEGIDQSLAAAAFATIDAEFGLSGQSEVHEMVAEAGNSSEPPENTTENS